jgi:hypothetical protein
MGPEKHEETEALDWSTVIFEAFFPVQGARLAVAGEKKEHPPTTMKRGRIKAALRA